MAVIGGSAVASAPPVPLEGDLKVYGDAACTQPAPTSYDFGKFPYTPCGGVCAPKTLTVWAKNESNYPMMLMVSQDNADLFLGAATQAVNANIIAIGDVLEVPLGICIAVPTNGQAIAFNITIKGNAIGAPK